MYDRTLGGEEETIRRIGDAPIVLTNKTVITESVLAACPSVRYIGVLATGYNIVDVEAAKRRGIPVCNIPSYCAESVAQLTFALLLEICHHAGDHSRAVHEGPLDLERGFLCFCGISRLLSCSAKRSGSSATAGSAALSRKLPTRWALQRVLAYSRHAPQDAGPAEIVPLDELLARSDVVSLHCPLNADSQGTHRRARSFPHARMGRSCSTRPAAGCLDRGGCCRRLRSGKLLAAGVDVVSRSRSVRTTPSHGGKLCVHAHIAWAPKDCRIRLMDTAVANVRAFLAGSPVNVVNG
ncbi:MAG: NAD(P)-dependent oxidoreductase [Oscillospiraceae bacterium]